VFWMRCSIILICSPFEVFVFDSGVRGRVFGVALAAQCLKTEE